MQNPDNHWFWNRESWDLNSGIQAKRSGIPLTIVPRTKNPECVYFTQLRFVQFLNLYYHTQNLMIFITKQFLLRNYETKLKKCLQEQHHTMRSSAKKTQQQFTIKSIVKQQATRFNQLKTNQNHSTVHSDTQ